MPNRYVRDACLDSDHYNSVGITGRLAFLELLLNADDFGLVPVHRVFLQRHVTAFAGLSSEAIGAELLSMDQADLIRCYTVGSNPFAYIPRNGFWIRSKRPKYPIPDFSAPQNMTRFNDLAEICIAHAVHMHPTTTYSSTSTRSTPNGVDPAAPISGSTKTIAVLDRKPAVAGAIPRCPIRKIVATYNETCTGCTPLQVPTATLHAHVSARWRQLFADGAASDYESAGKFFADFFARVQASKFLTGQIPPRSGSGKPFRASLRWLMHPENFAKTIEGEYDNR